ncbi:ABC transporter substrate-binding protein [Tianweitania sediminis]|uniref:ABC transporter substrate-binding protein n=1 Tax=Tianweitania sediminis TaxID=1502156 RepID=A0A8J7R049_9HYPH|nr:ABC transporter substrate-binding protein [Tianweitania sediminis]MBP0440033.1 ABC transporter substrate-binding protein [Tianweitania sediminis]HEV7415306.1 ABC transporter substrate-binding protein [Tianweitania sediminis]
MRNSLFSATILAAAALAVVQPAYAATPADTLVIVREISSIADWDPAVSQILDVNEINNDVYERLVGFDPRNPKELIGTLAESWTVAEDGSSITFKIRPDVKFHSGNPVTAQDVLFSFRRLMLLGREPSASMRAMGFTADNLDAGLQAPDDLTFVLKPPLKLAPSFVINLVSSSPFAIVDSELVKSHEKDGDFGSAWLSSRSSAADSAGSGPFKISTYRAGDLLILDRNDEYWQFTPSMRRVMFRHVPEAGTQRLLLENGDADVAFNITASDAEAMANSKDVRVDFHPSRRLLYFGFNTAKEPFDDPRVTKAMKYLIDYEGLEKTIMKNLGTIQQGFIAQPFLGATDERPFKLDVEKAKALLAEAGLSDGFSFTFTAYNRKPEMDLATSFQATAAQAGVKVNIVNMPVSQTIPLYRDRKLEALQLSYSGGYGDPHATASKFAFNPGALPGADPAAQWPSELSWRLGWAPKELSELTVQASQELDEAKRAELYAEMQKKAWEISPFAILFQATQALGMRADVQGYSYGARGADISFAAVTKNR